MVVAGAPHPPPGPSPHSRHLIAHFVCAPFVRCHRRSAVPPFRHSDRPTGPWLAMRRREKRDARTSWDEDIAWSSTYQMYGIYSTTITGLDSTAPIQSTPPHHRRRLTTSRPRPLGSACHSAHNPDVSEPHAATGKTMTGRSPHHATTQPRNHTTAQPRNHATTQSRNQAL
jgi:hypothetical protein